MRRISVALASLALVVGSCGGDGSINPEDHVVTPPPPKPIRATTQPTAEAGSVRLLFAGDVMLGRRVAPVARSERAGVFEEVRFVVSSADVAMANLESPLTTRPHVSDNPNALEADPSVAAMLAGAGFDVLSVANNHAGDAGPEGVMDTLVALRKAELSPLGAGENLAGAAEPFIFEHDGIRVALLAFDATNLGLTATATTPGVVSYQADAARAAVEDVRLHADLVAVSLHGGVEYLPDGDPILGRIAADLVSWGVDIVWGHGAHVPQPVEVATTPHGTPALIATSLGNFLFDQQRRATQTGLLLEVLVTRQGLVAYRVGGASHANLRVSFEGWRLPDGPAVVLDGEWWSLLSRPTVGATEVAVEGFEMGEVTTAAIGDVTGDGVEDLVVSYRHPFRHSEVSDLFEDRDWTDALGRSAHLGVFEPDTFRPIWAAGTLLRPVARIAVCDGSVALAFDSLDDPELVATGAWAWWDFGFAVPGELPGSGAPGCHDVDRDGRLDPIILRP